MHKQNPLSRHHALRLLASFGLVLGTAALAQASTPFTPNSTWNGMADNDGADTTQLDIISSNGNDSSDGNLSFKGVQLAVTVTWNSNGDIQIKDTNGQLTITGTVAPQWVTTSFSGTYSYLAPGARGVTTGTLSLLSPATQGFVSPDPTDANIPSISIVPPDWKGFFQAKSGASGGMKQQIMGGHSARSASSLVTGQLTLGSLVFNYVMTFAPTPNADGSFNFDLIGNNNLPGSAVAFTKVSGRFSPATSRSGAGMKGSFQLLGVCGNRVDLGYYSLGEAP